MKNSDIVDLVRQDEFRIATWKQTTAADEGSHTDDDETEEPIGNAQAIEALRTLKHYLQQHHAGPTGLQHYQNTCPGRIRNATSALLIQKAVEKNWRKSDGFGFSCR
jgi:hypothetical protein